MENNKPSDWKDDLIDIKTFAEKVYDNQLNLISDEELINYVGLTKVLWVGPYEPDSDKSQLIMAAQQYLNNEIPVNSFITKLGRYKAYLESDEFKRDLENGNINGGDNSLKIDLSDRYYYDLIESANKAKFGDANYQTHLFHLQQYRKIVEDQLAQADMVVDGGITYDEMRGAYNNWLSGNIPDSEYFTTMKQYLNPPGISKNQLEEETEEDEEEIIIEDEETGEEIIEEIIEEITSSKYEKEVDQEPNVGDLVQITPGAIDINNNYNPYPENGYIASGNAGYGVINEIFINSDKTFASINIPGIDNSNSDIQVDISNTTNVIYSPENMAPQTNSRPTKSGNEEEDKKTLQSLIQAAVSTGSSVVAGDGQYHIANLTEALHDIQHFMQSQASSTGNNPNNTVVDNDSYSVELKYNITNEFAPYDDQATTWYSGITTQASYRIRTAENSTDVGMGSDPGFHVGNLLGAGTGGGSYARNPIELTK